SLRGGAAFDAGRRRGLGRSRRRGDEGDGEGGREPADDREGARAALSRRLDGLAPEPPRRLLAARPPRAPDEEIVGPRALARPGRALYARKVRNRTPMSRSLFLCALLLSPAGARAATRRPAASPRTSAADKEAFEQNYLSLFLEAGRSFLKDEAMPDPGDL